MPLRCLPPRVRDSEALTDFLLTVAIALLGLMSSVTLVLVMLALWLSGRLG